jgi:DNA repair exonuclease SbcCD ATPase subunit
VADILNRSDLDELNPLKFYVIRTGFDPYSATSGPDKVVTGRISVNLEGQATDAAPRGSSDTPTLDAKPFAARTPRVQAASPAPIPVMPAPSHSDGQTPTQVMPAAGDVRDVGKWLADEVAADRQITALRQQLLAAQTELGMKGQRAGGRETEAVESLEKRIAELQETITESAQKKRFELLAQRQSALDNAARQAAAAMATAQIELERAAKTHDGLDTKDPVGAAFDHHGENGIEASKRLDEAKRAFEERKRAVEEVKRQFEDLRRQVETSRPVGQSTREVEEANRRDQSTAGAQAAVAASSEWTKKAAAATDRAQAVAKRQAEQAERAVDEAKRRLESTKSEDEAAASAGRDASRRALEQLHRQLEAADRQLEATKRQLDALVQQKEALAHQASELAKKLQQQSDDKQQP